MLAMKVLDCLRIVAPAGPLTDLEKLDAIIALEDALPVRVPYGVADQALDAIDLAAGCRASYLRARTSGG